VLLILCYIAKLEQMRGRGDLFLQDMSIVSLYDMTTHYLVLAQISRKKNIPLSEVHGDTFESEGEKYFSALQTLCFGIVGSAGFDRKTFNSIVGTQSGITLDNYVELGFVRSQTANKAQQDRVSEPVESRGRSVERPGPSYWYEFVHLSFVEYFAALSIVEQMKTQEGYDAFTLKTRAGLFLYKNQYNQTYVNFMQFIFGSIKEEECFRRFMSRLGENEKIFSDSLLLVNGTQEDAPNWEWMDRDMFLLKCSIAKLFCKV
jgi:hypothetical protein